MRSATRLQKGAPPTPQGKVLGAEGPKLIHALLTHPTALFISNVAIGPNGPDISGGAIVSTGGETDEIKASLEKIEHILLPTADAHWRSRLAQAAIAAGYAAGAVGFPR